MVIFYVRQFDKIVREKRRPIISRDNVSSVVCSNELCFIYATGTRTIHHVSKLVQGGNEVYFVSSFDHSEATIGAKLCVTSNEKGVLDRFVQVDDCSPC